MKNFLSKIKKYIFAHKIISIIVLLVVILIGSFIYKKLTSTTGETRYLTTKVSKGKVIVSISGSGQVSSLNQIDVKAKVSGEVVYIAAQDGQKISLGGLIAQLDNKDAEKSVRDAELNLESSKISLAKLKIEKSAENMNADLAKSYDDGFNTVSNTFLDLPGIMTGLNDMFFESNLATGQWNIDWYEGQAGNSERDEAALFKKRFIDSYNLARKSYDLNFKNYKLVSRTGDSVTIEKLIVDTYDTTKIIADAIKNANNYIDFVNDSIQKNNFDTPTIINTHKTTLNSYTSKTNTHLLNLLSIKTSIKGYKDAFLNSDLDIQSAELSLKQKENVLQDAKDKLADYFIRAPFSGTITKINIKKSDTISSGTVITTLITSKQLAEISLNEVDVAKINIGQKATLTFDAIPDLIISGVVTDIDTVGTVSQGVVTYTVKIAFDTQDDKIKPGMSVSGAIITDEKEGVLTLPNSAIKSQAGRSYVEGFDNTSTTNELRSSVSKNSPKKIWIKVGLVGDTQSEIISGIKEGDEIVTRTILPTANTTTSAPSIFGTPATGSRGTGAGNGNVRIQAR